MSISAIHSKRKTDSLPCPFLARYLDQLLSQRAYLASLTKMPGLTAHRCVRAAILLPTCTFLSLEPTTRRDTALTLDLPLGVHSRSRPPPSTHTVLYAYSSSPPRPIFVFLDPPLRHLMSYRTPRGACGWLERVREEAKKVKEEYTCSGLEISIYLLHIIRLPNVFSFLFIWQ